MKRIALTLALLATFTFAIACNNKKKETSSTENTTSGQQQSSDMASNDVAKVSDDNIKDELHRANLDDVKVHVDNSGKVIALSGDVKTADEKNQAEQIAKQHAAGYVVSNEIAVKGENDKAAGKVNSNLDDAIKSQWKAVVAQNNWGDQHIRSSVKNGVITLKGDVDTDAQRTAAQKAAADIPNVRQVVNELSVKNAGK